MMSKNTSGYQKNSRRPRWRATSHGNVGDLGGVHSISNGSGAGAGGFCKRKKGHENHEEESDEALEEHCEPGFRKRKEKSEVFLFRKE